MSAYKPPLDRYGLIIRSMVEPSGAYDHATMQQILEAVAQFVQNALVPTNKVGDIEGVGYTAETGQVTVPKAYHEAYRALCEGGYASLALDQDYGGGGASWVLHHFVSEMLASGNTALTTCPMLTNGALEALIKNGSQYLLDTYATQLIAGKYAATMCLTEPQCGTDLGLITTKAEKEGETYKITGQKIWITFGEHDLTENIIHLVLAKTPGSPEGSKGISMFVVPKILPDGSSNQLKCIGLEHKMGQNGSPTAIMAFDGAQGWLVGNECEGMKLMFEMMNPARIGVGVQALGLSEAAYQTALDFASTRRQSRSLDKKKQDLSASADLILVHPDVRRMLLHVESTNVAMRWLIAYCSSWLDQKDTLSGLLTPIVKSYVTEQSVENISTCMQVMGGMGYVSDGLCEQYYRDARITMIYEGTNGIQALDLIGRKIAKDKGKMLMRLVKLLKEMPVNVGDQSRKDALLSQLSSANTYLLKQVFSPENAAASAPHYLKLLALAVQYALLCQYETDTDLVEFYGEYVLPESSVCLARIQNGAKCIMANKRFNDRT